MLLSGDKPVIFCPRDLSMGAEHERHPQVFTHRMGKKLAMKSAVARTNAPTVDCEHHTDAPNTTMQAVRIA
eukprot:2317601-Amphidinium_carterae.2